MHSSRRSKFTTKSSNHLRQSSGRKINALVRRESQSYDEVDMRGSKDSGIAEDESISGGQAILYSATEVETSSTQDGGTMISGELNNSKENSCTERKQSFSGRGAYSTSQSRRSSLGEIKVCRHGVSKAEGMPNKENDDNLSQEGNESEGYEEGNLVKAVSYQNIIQFSQTSGEDFRIELSENDEEALKDELLHIFDRERSTLEMYFRNKMEERLRGFRNRQIEFEEAARAEKVELENNMSMEKMEMQKMFAEEIAKLTSSFNEERQQLESYHKEQLKDLREQLRTEQKQMDERFTCEKVELKQKLEAEYQMLVKRQISHEKEEAASEKIELEARFQKEKMELEKSYNARLTEAEANLRRLKTEFEANLADEKMRLEKQKQESLKEVEAKLHEEKQLRYEKEKELAQDKEKYFNEDSVKRKENEQLKNDVDSLRRQIDDKNRETLQLRTTEEKVRQKGRDGLEGRLKDDFEKLVAEHKMELEKNYQKDKERLVENLRAEKRKMNEENEREKEKIKSEQDNRKKGMFRNDEKTNADWRQQKRKGGGLVDVRSYSSNNRVEFVSGETERRTRQEQRIDGDLVGSRVGEQSNWIRSGKNEKQTQEEIESGSEFGTRAYSSLGTDLPAGSKGVDFHGEITTGGRVPRDDSTHLLSPQNDQALQSEIIALQRENEGLKAKIVALEENIQLHKKYKAEAKAEMERLLKENQEKDLQIRKMTSSTGRRETWNAKEEKPLKWPLPANDSQDLQYKAKYEATLIENNKLLEVTKDLELKIRNLQEKQTEILKQSLHLDKSSEKSGETERLKRLMSENSSLKQKTFELQTQLQGLLQKLKNDKEKAATLETKLSSHKSKSSETVQGLQERLAVTGRELSVSKGELDPDTLKRIEKEIVAISQIVKTQFGEGSMNHAHYNITNEGLTRITQLEVEKKELELKLKTAREAMREYISLLNEKMEDVKSMTGMSEEMARELHSRNNNLRRNLRALEEGQQTSQLQTEQLRRQKAALQNLIGDLCRDEETSVTSYDTSSRFQPSKHESEADQRVGHFYSSLSSPSDGKRESTSDETTATSYRHQRQRHEHRYDISSGNRRENFKVGLQERYSSDDNITEMQTAEAFGKRSRVDQFSTDFIGHPGGYSSFEYEDYSFIGS
ncbi:hypothetical protein P5673_007665 [Acropora cervicornis]|uniref:Uncharacterized protein n=1 Tax=Acropora cervicornis TaxID=6130 RepID=A0AAD9QUM4_ACRCE|nr:hypothetical protein P5673_007665 [Acropora cervicornis]